MNIRLFPELVHQMGLLIPAYAASGMASDVYISAVMCLLLRASRTEHKRYVTEPTLITISTHLADELSRTKSILNKLVRRLRAFS
jgi:hypothetical protein